MMMHAGHGVKPRDKGGEHGKDNYYKYNVFLISFPISQGKGNDMSDMIVAGDTAGGGEDYIV